MTMLTKLLNAVRPKNKRQSTDRIVSIAQRGMKDPTRLSYSEVRSLCASIISQAKTGDGK